MGLKDRLQRVIAYAESCGFDAIKISNLKEILEDDRKEHLEKGS